jgi:hypothetical protein
LAMHALDSEDRHRSGKEQPVLKWQDEVTGSASGMLSRSTSGLRVPPPPNTHTHSHSHACTTTTHTHAPIRHLLADHHHDRMKYQSSI